MTARVNTEYTHYLAAPWGWMFVAGVALTPAAPLLRTGVSSVLYYLLCLASLITLATGERMQRLRSEGELHYWRRFAGAGLTFIALILGAHVIQWEWPGAGFEKTVRFVLAVPLVLALRYVAPQQLRVAQWGFIITVLVMSLLLIFPPATFGTRPHTVEYSWFNTVEFGNLACLYMALTLYACGWPTTRFRRLELTVKLLVAGVAFHGMILSQTRTAWLALPWLVLLGIILLWRRRHWLRWLVLAGVVVGLGLLLALSEGLQQRFALAHAEYRVCVDQPHTDSSICNRVQLANAAWNLFLRAPVAGVGAGDAYREALHEQSRLGVISEHVAEHYGEPHNDYLYYLSAFGMLGLAGALLFLYVVPAVYLARGLFASPQETIWVACAMGLGLCGAFAAFGLTEMMFRGMRTASLYAILLSYFMALGAPPRPLRAA